MTNITEKEFIERLEQLGKWRFMIYPAIWLIALAMVLTELFYAIFRPIKYIKEKLMYKEVYDENLEMKSHIIKHFTDEQYEYYFGQSK